MPKKYVVKLSCQELVLVDHDKTGDGVIDTVSAMKAYLHSSMTGDFDISDLRLGMDKLEDGSIASLQIGSISIFPMEVIS